MVRQLFLVVLDGRRGLKQASSTSLEAEIRLRDLRAFEWCQNALQKDGRTLAFSCGQERWIL